MTDRFPDRVLLLVACLALCVEVLWLLAEMRLVTLPAPFTWKQSGEASIGLVEWRHHAVKSRASGSLTWYPLGDGDAIHLNDTILTGSDATARLNIDGHGSLELGPDTLIQFRAERQGSAQSVINLEMDQGKIRVAASEAPLRMRVKRREIRLAPGTRVEIAQSLVHEAAEVEVERGEASIIDEGAPAAGEVVKAGEAVKLAAREAPKKIDLHLSVTDVAPADGARLVANGDRLDVSFQWKGEAEKVELDHEAAFAAPRTAEADGSHAKLSLAPGAYYWRLRREEASSGSYHILVLPDPKYEAIAPEPTARLKETAPIHVEWRGVKDAESYRLQVARDAEFASVVYDSTSNRTEAQVERLAPGTYYWRVQALSPEWGEWPASAAYSFTVRKQMSAPKLKGVKILPRKSELELWLRHSIETILSLVEREARAAEPGKTATEPEKKKAPIVDDKAVASKTVYLEFQWEPVEGAAGYRLEVSDEPNFKHVLSRIEGKETTQSLELPRQEKFYWRVAARDADGELSSFSKAEIALPKPKPLPPPPPAPPKVVIAAPPPPPPPPEPKLKPALPWFVPSRVSGGLMGTVRNEALGGDAFHVSSRGVYGGLGVQLQKQFDETLVSLEYERAELHYSTRALTNNLPAVTSGIEDAGSRVAVDTARFLVRHTVFKGAPEITFGLSYQKQIDFVSVDPDHIQARTLPWIAALIGPNFELMNEGKFFATAEILAELAPIGEARGVGIFGRATLGWRRVLGPISPTLQIAFHPSYYSVPAVGHSVFRMEIAPMLLLSFIFEPPLGPDEERMLEETGRS